MQNGLGKTSKEDGLTVDWKSVILKDRSIFK